MEIRKIPIKKIKIFDNSRLEVIANDPEFIDFMRSIKEDGMLHPVGASKIANGYFDLKYGYRRYLAAKKLGWKYIDASMLDRELDESDSLIINVIENVQRKNITPLELGRVLKILKEKYGLNKKEIAVRLSIPTSRVDSCLNLFKVVPENYQKKMGFVGHNNRSSKIPVSIISLIAGTAKRMSLSKEVIESLFEYIKKEGLGNRSVRLLLSLLKTGLSVEEAIKKLNDYSITFFYVINNAAEINKLKKEYGLQSNKIMQNILMGKIPPLKKAVVFYN